MQLLINVTSNIPNPTFTHIPHISYLRFRKSNFNSETCFISRKLNTNYLRKTLLLKCQYFKGLIFQLLHSKNQNFDFAGWELFFQQFFCMILTNMAHISHMVTFWDHIVPRLPHSKIPLLWELIEPEILESLLVGVSRKYWNPDWA